MGLGNNASEVVSTSGNLGIYTFGSAGGTYLALGTNSAEAIRIDQSRNVGVGTPSPASRYQWTASQANETTTALPEPQTTSGSAVQATTSSEGGVGVSGISPNVGIFAHNSKVAGGHDAFLASGCCAGDFNGDVFVHGKVPPKLSLPGSLKLPAVTSLRHFR